MALALTHWPLVPSKVPMLAVGWGLGAAGGPAKRAFIGGGGECATARELLKHPSLEEVVMVDLDQLVVETCVAHLPEWPAGCMSDPRLKVARRAAAQRVEMV